MKGGMACSSFGLAMLAHRRHRRRPIFAWPRQTTPRPCHPSPRPTALTQRAAGNDNGAALNEPSPNLALAKKVISTEAACVAALVERVDERFAQAAQAIYRCSGTVVLTGIGKAGIIANKISATFASTGTCSIFLHPVEALHGDLGRLRRDDLVVALSHSGATDELLNLVDHIKARGARLVAITSCDTAPLARHADIALCYGKVEEACPLGLAPSASTTCMLALGDALALTVMEMRQFSPEDFAAFHPAGALGRMMLKVDEAMTFRLGQRLPVAGDWLPVRQVLTEAERIHRRAGAVLLVDREGRLTGILTDSDFRRRILAEPGDRVLDRPISEIMVRDPLRIRSGELASAALAIMTARRIDELPVVDADDRPVGLLDVQDLVGLKAFNHGHD